MADSNAPETCFKFLKIENMVVMTVGKNNILHSQFVFSTSFAILFASLPGSITAQVLVSSHTIYVFDEEHHSSLLYVKGPSTLVIITS